MINHHAFLVRSDTLSMLSLKEEYRVPSVDVTHIIADRFSIDDARKLVADAWQKPLQSPKRTFVIATRDVATEAQNALLKLFEEPPESSEFYLILLPTSFLLPTLRSRLMESSVQEEGNSDDKVFRDFMKASYGERIAEIAEKTKEKDFPWIDAVVKGSETLARDKKEEKLLRAVILCRANLTTKGASVKMLLEELALLL